MELGEMLALIFAVGDTAFATGAAAASMRAAAAAIEAFRPTRKLVMDRMVNAPVPAVQGFCVTSRSTVRGRSSTVPTPKLPAPTRDAGGARAAPAPRRAAGRDARSSLPRRPRR